MTNKLPKITAAEVIKVLEKIGFLISRQSGSHKIYKSMEGKRTTVPYHAGKILHSKILKSILRDINLTIDEFKELMK
jgi:predicted RNA binding protein YcfA (HicA-like mRNA interferase family)